MEFKINPAKLSSAFTLPGELADKHLKLSGAVQLKVILWAFRHIAEGVDVNRMSEELGISAEDVKDALGFWCELGYFTADAPAAAAEQPPEKKKVTRRVAEKPGRQEIAERARDDDKISFILNEAQIKFGRMLRQNESSTLIWLYSDEGMSPAVLLMAIDYCINSGHGTIGYIEKLAVDWLNNGIDTIAAAEERITLMSAQKDAWRLTQSAFGLARRSPSSREEKLSYKWVYEWGFGRDILKEAYDRTVDALSSYNSRYIEKILENWHKLGVKTKDDLIRIESENKKEDQPKKEDYAAYDKNEYLKQLDSDYE